MNGHRVVKGYIFPNQTEGKKPFLKRHFPLFRIKKQVLEINSNKHLIYLFKQGRVNENPVNANGKLKLFLIGVAAFT